MTCYRLDNHCAGEISSSEMVDGFERDEVALRLLLATATESDCRLYGDGILIAERTAGVWWIARSRPRTYRDHALYCRHEAMRFEGRAEKPFLLRLAREFEALAHAPRAAEPALH